MTRRWFTPLALVVIVGLLMTGVPVRDRLMRARRTSGLKEVELSELPPLGAASLLLLGGFRGVAVDLLWLRVIALHQQREYEEEISLIELITRVQPYYISVWVFQAWNIAYNISVQYPDPADQWVRVKYGIEFLKRGLQLNPNNADLHFYLAIMFRDKVSQNPFFEDACEKGPDGGGLGVNNYEEAARYFDRARKIGGVQTFHPRVVDSGVFHSCLQRVQQIFRRAELTDDLAFAPGTLEKAQGFVDQCREEARGLQERWPDDDAFAVFPSRADLVLSDGYLDQVDKILYRGDFSDPAVDRARKVLDKALGELAKYRPKYEHTRSKWVLDNKTGDAWTRIPAAILRHVEGLMNKPFAGVGEGRRSLQLLGRAETVLAQAPESAREYKDLQMLLVVVPAARKSIERFIEEQEKPGPLKSGTDGE